MSDNPYAAAAAARRNATRDFEDELNERKLALDERERALDEREAKIDREVEAAAELIIAMAKDSKRGQVVAWAKFSQAALALEKTSPMGRARHKELIAMLKAERVLDLEERKDTPTTRGD